MGLWQRWKDRHRHDWIVYGSGRLCKICAECCQYRCEDGATGVDCDLTYTMVKRRAEKRATAPAAGPGRAMEEG